MLADEDGLEEGEMQGESILGRVSHLYKDIKTACQEVAVLIFFFLGVYRVGRDGRLRLARLL